jgi:alkylhydroperoxidase/carboxymuconolactone decarboxylase family protein YurZ
MPAQKSKAVALPAGSMDIEISESRRTGCIGFHMEALVKLGATRAEVEEALGMAVCMGGGSSLMYAADALGAFEQFSAPNL